MTEVQDQCVDDWLSRFRSELPFTFEIDLFFFFSQWEWKFTGHHQASSSRLCFLCFIWWLSMFFLTPCLHLFMYFCAKEGCGQAGKDSVCFISVLVPCVQCLWLILIISGDLTAFHFLHNILRQGMGVRDYPKSQPPPKQCGVYLTKLLRVLINRRENCGRQGIRHTFPSL